MSSRPNRSFEHSLKNPDSHTITFEPGVAVTALHYAAAAPRLGASLILGHGAGAGQNSPFMVSFAHGLAGYGVDVDTFNFPYIEQRKRVPDRRPVLEACYRAVIAGVRERLHGPDQLFIGGKSMGGRMATYVAATDQGLPLAGLILLGYPLHPPGRPAERRDAHLPDIRRPMLIVQGSRDAFGRPPEFAAVLQTINPLPILHVVEGGDHSFKISRLSKDAQQRTQADVHRTVAEWIRAVCAQIS